MPSDSNEPLSSTSLVHAAPPEPAQADAQHGDQAGVDYPWNQANFDPFGTTNKRSFYADGGVTYKRDKHGDAHIVCQFVPEPVGEIVTILDLDQPERREQRLVLRYTLPSGHQQVVTLDPGGSGDVAPRILRGVPSDLARASVVNKHDVALAAWAFRSPSFEKCIRVRQCGWLPDGTFALPGADVVDLQHVDELAGAQLWGIPSAADREAAREGALALLEVCASAPVEAIMPVIGTIFAAPIFRRNDHIAARGFATFVVGPSQRGKTTLVRSACGLLGRFDQQPGCVATWSSTFASLEQALHAYRDLPVFIDDFRETDGEAQETFRRLVLALGDGAGRGRTAWSTSGARVARALQPVALLLATGEQSVEDDAAIAGRVVEIPALGIDVKRLLRIPPGQQQAMPHVYAAYLSFVSSRSADYWASRREEMRAFALELGSSESRAGENLATLKIALDVASSFVEYFFDGDDEIVKRWRSLLEEFGLVLPKLMSQHAERIREGSLDAVVLEEVARGLRAEEIRLAHLPSGRTALPDARGKLVGAFDREHVYLMPDIITRWASDQLRRAGRRSKAVGRKTLSQALAARAGVTGDFRTQLTIEKKRPKLWPIPRSCLGAEWDGLLDE